jgi:hypothetical protein
MSTQFKFSILIIFLLFGCSSDDNEFYQGEYDEKTKTCLAKDLSKHVFKVNVETQKVMHTVTDADGNQNSIFWNCNVINDKNFICGEVLSSRIILSEGKIKFELNNASYNYIPDNCWYKKQLFWMKKM